MNCPSINISQACKAIRGFNADLSLLAMDSLVEQTFRPMTPSTTALEIAERAVLIDRLWATQMFRRPGHIGRVIDCLHANRNTIAEVCNALPKDALELETERVVDAAATLMPIVMAIDSEGYNPYTPYSFGTKYLHWTTRNHFPIMDQRARTTLCALYRSQGHKPPIAPVTEGRLWRIDYTAWIRIFGRLLGGLSDADRDALHTADHQSTAPSENSLLRILDKVFYMWNGSIPSNET